MLQIVQSASAAPLPRTDQPARHGAVHQGEEMVWRGFGGRWGCADQEKYCVSPPDKTAANTRTIQLQLAWQVCVETGIRKIKKERYHNM